MRWRSVPMGKLFSVAVRDKTVKLWETSSGQLLHTFTGHQGRVNAVAFSPDGETVLSSSWDNTLKLWETSSGQLLHTLTRHQDWFSALEGSVNAVAFSPRWGNYPQ